MNCLVVPDDIALARLHLNRDEERIWRLGDLGILAIWEFGILGRHSPDSQIPKAPKPQIPKIPKSPNLQLAEEATDLWAFPLS